MKVLVILSALLAAATAEYCYGDVAAACSPRHTGTSDASLLANCNARYGNFERMEASLQAYANAQIEASFEHLLMSAHFGNYEADREGFKGLYRKLSDRAWEDAMDIIKFIAKRGGKMNFNEQPKWKRAERKSEIDELTSLAKALDTQKQLAKEALDIHMRSQQHSDQDASVAHYIEEKFIEPQADCVRSLAGHVSDFKKLLTERNARAVSVFLFDEILKKSL